MKWNYILVKIIKIVSIQNKKMIIIWLNLDKNQNRNMNKILKIVVWIIIKIFSLKKRNKIVFNMKIIIVLTIITKMTIQ
jgi:hypothetical protein